MDFLTTALYALDSDGVEQLAGALLTKFDPKDIVSRAYVRYVTAEQLKRGTGIQPSGFKMDENGVLLSDTQARRAMNNDLANYVSGEVTGEVMTPPPSLLDVVLYGARYGASVLVNMEELIGDEIAEPILLPMSSLKVSNSSFNIYAPYKNTQGKFRTLSLVDITTDEAIPFAMAVPNEMLSNFNAIAHLMTPLNTVAIPEYSLFGIDAKFEPFYTFTGEAFCNYLAYNVSYCNIGLKVMDAFLTETKYVSDGSKDDEAPRTTKVPRHNLSIECTCRNAHLHEVLNSIGDMERLKELVKDDEAYITFTWLQTIYRTADEFEGKGNEERLAAACVSLQRECKLQRLHYAIELLAQRYYLLLAGRYDNTIGQILRGGGVNGCAIKRVTGQD